MQSVNFCFLIGLLSLWAARPTLAQQESPTANPSPNAPTPTQTFEVVIHSPKPGQALQGVVLITGNTAIPGFIGAEIAFAYTNDPTHTWFHLLSMDQPVSEGVLAQWDTNVITDGNYDLRLTVFLENNQQVIYSIPGLRIRNYTPIETSTPTPATPTATPLPGPRATSLATIVTTPTMVISPTPLPTNPLELTSRDMRLSLGKGALTVVGLFALIGIYQTLKKIRERD